MRAIGVATLALCLPAFGPAQGFTMFQPSVGRGVITAGDFTALLRSDRPSSGPPSPELLQRFGTVYKFGRSFFSRALTDEANHVYFGYEVMLEVQEPGTYLARFGNIGISPLEVAANLSHKAPWTMRALRTLPQPRVVHDGDVISVELLADAATGAKLFDDVRINRPGPGILQPPPHSPPPQVSVRPTPTVSGTAREFSADNVEMRLLQPRVTLNGEAQPVTDKPSNVMGSLVWFYLPGHGRYILSLTPRPELDFQKAGELRGGIVTFTIGGDAIKLESPVELAPGGAPYILYVLHDPDFEPTAQAQKGQFAAGSVGTGELAALERR